MSSQVYTNAVTLSDATEWDRWDTAAYCYLTSVSGTNTITATGPANMTLAAPQHSVILVPAATNTGATTLNITPSGGAALTAKNVFMGGAACVGGELTIGVPAVLVYDGTQYNIISGPNYTAGNFTGTLTGCTTSPTDVIYYVKIGRQVTIQAAVGFSVVVSNAVTKTITGMPAAIRPGRDMYGTIDVIDNGGTEQKGTFSIASTGVISLFPTAARGNWTGSGNFSTEPILVTYQQT